MIASMLHHMAAAATMLFGLTGSAAWAQGPARYYSPSGPTLPSQLNYFRRDVGLLDQYNTFVQPRQQLDFQFQQLAAQQAADFRATQRQLEQIKEIRPSEAAPTGVGGTYMNYLHYYRLPTRSVPQPRTR
jgi:hypothetical protein